MFDRFIAIKVGDELRAIESALSEDSGAEKEIFARFQVRHSDVYIPVWLEVEADYSCSLQHG